MKTFRQYHSENPKIYQEFEKIAFQLIRRGYKRLSSKFICEIVRYNSMISGNDGFKINNSYTADYARLFEMTNKEYFGYFSKRLLTLRKE